MPLISPPALRARFSVMVSRPCLRTGLTVSQRTLGRSTCVRGRSWPPLAQGDEIFERAQGINVPIAGFIDQMRKSSHHLITTAWAGTTPSAHVTRDAFERIATMILTRLQAAAPVDGVYLD